MHAITSKFLLAGCCLLGMLSLSANNIEVSNVSLTGQSSGDATTQIQFDLSWENSWRISVGPSNWDAAWVFAKYRVNGDLWRHATLNLSGGVAPGDVTIDVSDDQLGAFIFRAVDGSGNVDWEDLQLQWDYGADGVDENALVDIQVFALEMVYVPEGAFQLGTGFALGGNEVEAGRFRSLQQFGQFFFQTPYNVNSEAAITVASAVGDLWYDEPTGGSRPGDQLGPIPAAFPKGFSAFYCQKYETSQDQWVGFFNSLTQAQKEALDITGPDGKGIDDELNRNGISWPDGGAATTTLPNIPLNYVNNDNMLAYLDWSGLRPMTELEYEKACRGTLPSVSNGFAWGTTNIHVGDYTYLNEGEPNEIITNPASSTGNVLYGPTNGSPSGPKRCGIVAASAALNNREETGATYYGIMEMTGNLYERPISAGNPEGRAFEGGHGDGIITGGGRHNVADWPDGNTGLGYRGGSFFNGANFVRVSDRYDAATTLIGANNRLGFRSARTAD